MLFEQRVPAWRSVAWQKEIRVISDVTVLNGVDTFKPKVSIEVKQEV